MLEFILRILCQHRDGWIRPRTAEQLTQNFQTTP